MLRRQEAELTSWYWRDDMTKKEMQERVDSLGRLLFEAVHLLRTEDYSDEDREQVVNEFLYRCQKEGIV